MNRKKNEAMPHIQVPVDGIGDRGDIIEIFK